MTESTRIPRRRKSKGDGQFMFSALILVLVIASLLGMYFYLEDHLEDQKNQNKLEVEVIKEKIGRIEGKLSLTDEDSAQNMATITDQITLLDDFARTQIDRLWQNRIRKTDGYLVRFTNLENSNTSNENNIKTLKSQINGLDDKIKSIDNKVQLAEDLQFKITLLSNELNKQKKILENNSESLDAIDQYRRQNNQKITEVLNRLNNLSRELDEIEAELNSLNLTQENNE
tara:strand:- start:259 stop:945 length:687 start_codon:yes stop_codon:yes gene_type:complete